MVVEPGHGPLSTAPLIHPGKWLENLLITKSMFIV